MVVLPLRRSSAAVDQLPDACLLGVLASVPASERHRTAAWVSPRWRQACVVLALRLRAAGGGPHPAPLPMTAAVATRVRAAQRRMDPDAAPEAWTAGGYGSGGRWDPACTRCCGAHLVPTFAFGSDLDAARFEREFAGRLPCLITGLGGQWAATQQWSMEQLWSRSAPRKSMLRVGDDDASGEPVKLAMRDYLQYLCSQQDDDPLYLFDEDFGKECPEMLDGYTVPAELFADDVLPRYAFLNDASEQEQEQAAKPAAGPEKEEEQQQQQLRPTSRKWLLIGPRGSGTDVHTDPDGTGAWNSVIHGTKRWAFIQPSVPEAEVLGPASHYVDHLPACAWFANTLPQLVAKYPLQVQEVIQVRTVACL